MHKQRKTQMKNEILNDKGYVLEIDIGTHTCPDAVMTINKGDYRKIRKQYKGRIHAEVRDKRMYARINIGSDCILVHKLIHPDWTNIDHRDGDGLNNRRSNLRKATDSQNLSNRTRINKNNTSGCTGVIPTRNGRWKAVLHCRRKNVYLGTYSDKADAVLARLKGEAKYYKSFMPKKNRKLLAQII